jgi:hypothetical protein
MRPSAKEPGRSLTPEGRLPFKLITPTGALFDDAVQKLTVTPVGEFGVLPQHINCHFAGAMRRHREDGRWKLLPVRGLGRVG